MTSEFTTRRQLLAGSSMSLFGTALGTLLNSSAAAETEGVYRTQLPRKIRRVIWLTMAGGPSHLDLFDRKQKLADMNGELMPEEFTAGQQLAQLQGQKLFCLGPQFPFRRYGQCGMELSELLPQIGGMADDICLVRSMTTDAINHDPAHMFMNTGSQIAGRPGMGAWVTYGLGSEAENLPGFIVLVSTGPGRSPQPIAARQWNNGFLPGRCQGVRMRSTGEPVLYLNSPPGVGDDQQEADVAAVNSLNRLAQERLQDPEIATRIVQYELAFRMQSSVPELTDVSGESQTVMQRYGCEPGDGSFAANCLLARRLAERGVRFIQLYHRDWDHHSLLREELPMRAREVDQASAALITDLQERGMLDETLIVWSGEFGRTPMSQSNKGPIGRDHHNRSMSMWMAGGGIRGGTVYGATDELGYAAAEDICTVHDLHATMLHQLGIDHEQFSFRFQGLDVRLTGVEPARVLSEILS